VLLPPFFCDGTVTSALHTLSLHDALPICLRALELARSKTRIEQDERMEVAVAGMKDVRHAQPMSHARVLYEPQDVWEPSARDDADRKSTRLNSSHVSISYAVSCLKKKNEL